MSLARQRWPQRSERRYLPAKTTKVVSICTGGKILTVLLVLPSISASASIAFRWAVGFAFYAMERHHDPRTEAVGARRCRLGHMLRRFQPLFCGRRHAQPFLCVGERAGGARHFRLRGR